MLRKRVLMLLGLLLVLAQVPSSWHAPRQAWAEEALQWLRFESEAWRKGVPHILLFAAPDIVFDDCCSAGEGAEGLEVLNQYLPGGEFRPTIATASLGEVFVDVAGVVAEYRYDDPAGDDNDLAYQEIGPLRIRVRSHAQSIIDLRRHWPVGADDMETAEALAGAYLSAWSSSDPGNVAALYASDSRLIDSLWTSRAERRSKLTPNGFASRGSRPG